MFFLLSHVFPLESFDLAGARVVPLMGLGGASGGDFGFPLQALEVPTWRLGVTGGSD